MAEWKHINAENLKPFYPASEEGDYSSKLLTGSQLAGSDVININEGTVEGVGGPAARRTRKQKFTISSGGRANCG